MLLSNLVQYRQRLESITPNSSGEWIKTAVEPALHFITNNEIQFGNLTQRLTETTNSIYQCFNGYSGILGELQDEITRAIEKLEPQYLTASNSLYEESFKISPSKTLLKRDFNLSNEEHLYLSTRVAKKGSWQHAGLVIRPYKNGFVDSLVAWDPLYIVDKDMDMLRPVLDQYNEQYRRRLRPYFLNETGEGKILQDIPNGQFGFALVYFFFHFTPVDVIKQYLEEIYEKLKPGGTVAFTFNNCDYPYGIRNFERNFMCYTPARLVLLMCQHIGYEVAFTHQIDGACGWVELNKPGELSTLRGGQSLAEILPKELVKSK